MSSKVKIYPVAILLVVSFVTLWAKDQESKKVDKAGEKSLKPEKRKQYSERDMKAWALSCSALLIERNHGRHDLLGTDSRTPKDIEEMQDFLATRPGWGIKSQSDLFDWLRRIDNGGHRKEFEGLGRLLQTLSEQEYQELLKRDGGDPEILHRIKVVNKHYEKLGPKSILGWDYIRYICLCRWSYLAEYITEEEAWKKIMPVAKMLQTPFDSWEDLGRNYIIGRQFWSYEETIEEGRLFEDAYQRLIDMKSSPWNKYPWDMDLTKTESISEPNEAELKRFVRSDYTNIGVK